MKDARSEGAPTKGPGPASDTGTVNEEPSRSVPAEAPDTKGKKMANPKAVSGDNERLGTEVSFPVFFTFLVLVCRRGGGGVRSDVANGSTEGGKDEHFDGDGQEISGGSKRVVARSG